MFSLLVVACAGFANWGCSRQEGPAEKLGKQVDKAAKESGKAVDNAAQKAQKAVEDANK
jgi:hypothetical protein